MKMRSGFTLVELVIVIVVVAILATLTTLGLTGYRNDANDARAESNVSTLAEALEKYYEKHGDYPSCGALTGSPEEVTSSVLPGLDQSALIAPGAPAGTKNSIRCGQTLAATGENFIQYTGDGSQECNGSGSCLSYSLRYRKDADKAIVAVESRHAAVIATSGTPVISASTTGFSSISTSWTATPNANNYSVQRATNAAFTAGLSTKTVSATATTTSFDSLSTGVTYYFRVKATRTGDETAWSNTAQATTDNLSAPALTATASSSTAMATAWNAVSLAQSYQVQQSTSSSFTSPESYTITTRAQNYSALTQGGRYYYRVRAIANNSGTAVNGPWSSTVNQTTTVNTPSAPVMTSQNGTDNGSYDTTAFAWNPGSTCPTGTDMQYQSRYYYDTTNGYTSAWSSATTTTGKNVTTYDGYYYRVDAQARCRNTSTQITSAWSSVASAAITEDVRQPQNLNWVFTRADPRTVRFNITGTCRTGTSIFGHLNAYSGTLRWVEGPHAGQTGWYSDGDALTYMYYPNWGVYNVDGNQPAGAHYIARGVFTCKNSTTGRENPNWIFNQSGSFYW